MSAGTNRLQEGGRSEKDRIALIKAGDRREIGLLFEELAGYMLSTLRARWPDRQGLVQDAVQYAFLKLIQNPLSIRAETMGELRRWLYQVATNHLKDQVKSAESKRATPFSSLAACDPDDDQGYLEKLPDRALSVEEIVEQDDILRSVWGLVDSLGNDCAEILRMFYGQALTLAQIAQRLDRTLDGIKKRKVECLAALIGLAKQVGILA